MADKVRQYINQNIENGLNSQDSAKQLTAAHTAMLLGKHDAEKMKLGYARSTEESQTQALMIRAMTLVDISKKTDSELDPTAFAGLKTVTELQQELSDFTTGKLKLTPKESLSLRSELAMRSDGPQMSAPLTEAEVAYIEEQRVQLQNNIAIPLAGVGGAAAAAAAAGGASPARVNLLLNQFVNAEMAVEGVSLKMARVPTRATSGPYGGEQLSDIPLGWMPKGTGQRGSVGSPPPGEPHEPISHGRAAADGAVQMASAGKNLPPDPPQLVKSRAELNRLQGLASQYSAIIAAYDAMHDSKAEISKLESSIDKSEKRYAKEHPESSYAESRNGVKQIARLEALKANDPESRYVQSEQAAKAQFDAQALPHGGENQAQWVPWPKTNDEYSRLKYYDYHDVQVALDKALVAEKNTRPSTPVLATGQPIDVIPERRKLAEMAREINGLQKRVDEWEYYSFGDDEEAVKPPKPTNRLDTPEGMAWLRRHNHFLHSMHEGLSPLARMGKLEHQELKLAQAELDYVKELAQQQYIKVRHIEEYNHSLGPHPQHVATKTPAELAVGDAQRALLALAETQQQPQKPYLNVDFKSLSKAAEQGRLPPELQKNFQAYQAARAQASEVTANNPLIFKSKHLSSILHEVDSPDQIDWATQFKNTLAIQSDKTAQRNFLLNRVFTNLDFSDRHCIHVAEVITQNLLGTGSSVMPGQLPAYAVKQHRLMLPPGNLLKGLSSGQVEEQMQAWGDGAVAWFYSKGHVSVIVNDAGEIKVIEGQRGLHLGKLEDYSPVPNEGFDLIRRDYMAELDRPAGFESQTTSAAGKNEPAPMATEPVVTPDAPAVEDSLGR